MSPVPSLFQLLLLRLVLCLVAVFGQVLEGRLAGLRRELRGLPAGSRRRAWVERDIARLEALAEWISDPEVLADVRYRGMIAEAAVWAADPGRRAWIRWRWIYGWGCRSWRRLAERAREGAEGALAVARCRCALV